ncbi:MAG: DUF4337 domain-containing protein [Rhodoferax sp.]
MEAQESAEIVESIHETPDPSKTRAALLVSILAMVLAITSMGGSNAAKDATHNNILAANAYAFYQAKNIRQTHYKIALDQLEIALAKDEKLPATARELMQKKADDYRKNIQRYESEPETREGKKELLASAKDLELQRDLALRRDPWFDYAEGFLQIGIVLASVAIVTATPALLLGALGLGVLGTLSAVNGFLLLV